MTECESISAFQNRGSPPGFGDRRSLRREVTGVCVPTAMEGLSFNSNDSSRNRCISEPLMTVTTRHMPHARISGGIGVTIAPTQPGEAVQLLLGASLSRSQTTTLVNATDLKVVRLIVPAGKVIPPHNAPGEITVQCLEGRVEFTVHGQIQELTAGQWLFLTAGEPHAVTGVENSSLLVTLLYSRNTERTQRDVVPQSTQ